MSDLFSLSIRSMFSSRKRSASPYARILKDDCECLCGTMLWGWERTVARPLMLSEKCAYSVDE